MTPQLQDTEPIGGDVGVLVKVTVSRFVYNSNAIGGRIDDDIHTVEFRNSQSLLALVDAIDNIAENFVTVEG